MRRLRSQRGAGVIEAVVAVPALLILIFMGMECCILAYKSITLQFLVHEQMRTVVTGKCPSATTNECSSHEIAAYAWNEFKLKAARFGLSVTGNGTTPQGQVCISRFENRGTCNGGSVTQRLDGGQPGDLMIMEVTHKTKFLGNLGYYVLHLGEFNVRAVALGRNEAYGF